MSSPFAVIAEHLQLTIKLCFVTGAGIQLAGLLKMRRLLSIQSRLYPKIRGLQLKRLKKPGAHVLLVEMFGFLVRKRSMRIIQKF
jgi:hypothetical protein